MILRDLVGLAMLLVGAVAVIAAMIASGWWGLVFLGALALVFGGLPLVIYRPVEASPKGGEVERQTTS